MCVLLNIIEVKSYSYEHNLLAKHIDKIAKSSENQKEKHSESKQDHTQRGPETEDPLGSQDRIITFTNKISKVSKEDSVRQKSAEFKEQVRNTGQFFRFSNSMIIEKMEKMQQLKEDQKRFQDTINMLQNKMKSRFDLEQINIKQFSSDDAKALVFHLDDEFERLKDRLLYQELIVQKTKDEIAEKKKQIQQVKEELKVISHSNPKHSVDPITTLKIELKKEGISESSKVFQILNQIEERLYEKSSNVQKS